MTTIGERIRVVRKSHGLTLEKFGEKIGITASSLSTIENGKSNPSEQTIRSIIREFNVSELWLRTGEGEMFELRSAEEEIAEFARSVITSGTDSFRARFIAALSKLTPEGWAVLEQIAEEMQKSSDTKPND